MTLLKNLPTGVASGTVVVPGSTGNTGGASGDYFDSYVFTGGTITYDTTHAFRTEIAYRVAGSGASGATYVSITRLGGIMQWAAEVYVYLTALPASEQALIWASSATTAQVSVGILATGKLVQRASGTAGTDASGKSNSGTAVIPLNQWVRIEFSGTVGAGTGTMQSAMYSVDSTTALDSLSTTGQNTGSAGLNNARFGNAQTGTVSSTYWLSGMQFSDNSTFLGPYPTSLPTLTGTVLASDNFTGTDGASLAAQWTPNVSAGGSVLIGGNKAVLTPAPIAWGGSAVAAYLSGAPATQNTDWDLFATLCPANPIAGQYISMGMSNNGTLRSGDLKPGHGYSVGLFPSGGTFGVSKVTSGVSASLSGDLTYAFAAGVNVNVRMKMAGGTTLSVWVWNQGTTMPTTPTWTATDAAPLTGTFKPLLSASNASSATPTPAGFDDFAYAVSAATQGWFIHNGTIWVHYVANLNNGTAFVAMPASEVS